MPRRQVLTNLPWPFFVAHTTPSSGGANHSCCITPGQSLLDGAVGARASKNPRRMAILGTAFWTVCALADRQPWQRAFQWDVVRSFLTSSPQEHSMNRIVYLVGAVVIILAVLSFFGLR